MFQDAKKIGPEQIPDAVKAVFASHRAMVGMCKELFARLRDPNLVNLSHSELRAMVDAWEQKVKTVAQETLLGW